MKPITQLSTVAVKMARNQTVYVGAYADKKTAERVREHIKDFAPSNSTLTEET